jgi:hypothetical protein
LKRHAIIGLHQSVMILDDLRRRCPGTGRPSALPPLDGWTIRSSLIRHPLGPPEP